MKQVLQDTKTCIKYEFPRGRPDSIYWEGWKEHFFFFTPDIFFAC